MQTAIASYSNLLNWRGGMVEFIEERFIQLNSLLAITRVIFAAWFNNVLQTYMCPFWTFKGMQTSYPFPRGATPIILQKIKSEED